MLPTWTNHVMAKPGNTRVWLGEGKSNCLAASITQHPVEWERVGQSALARLDWRHVHHSQHRATRPRSRARLGALGNGAARSRARDHFDREGLRRSRGARSADRDLRDQGRAAQRRTRRRAGVVEPGISRLAAPGRDRRHRRDRVRGAAERAHARGREHAKNPQHGRLHAVLLLSLGGARAAAGLVQIGALSLARGCRSARRAARVRPEAAGRDRDPRLGFDRRGALPRGADAAGRHRGLERGKARRAGDPRFHDRDRIAAIPRRGAMNGAHDMGGVHGFGPGEPEPNEPVFHAAWERRAFAITVAMGATGEWNIDMSRFARENRAPADYLAKSYYELWLAGLEALLAECRLVSAEEVAAGCARGSPRPVKRVLAADDVDRVLSRGTAVGGEPTATAG